MGDFSPGQIIYLEHQGDRLYGEVIQVVSQRQMVWLRPLLLVNGCESAADSIPLHGTADLLWPIERFQAALDSDVLPLLASLGDKSAAPVDESKLPLTRILQLRQFIDRAWQGQKYASS